MPSTSIKISAVRLERELAIRDMTARDLAERAGVSETLISRARHGRPITARSLHKIVDALSRIKPNELASSLLPVTEE